MPSKRVTQSLTVNTSIKFFTNPETVLLISSNCKQNSIQPTGTTQLQSSA